VAQVSELLRITTNNTAANVTSLAILWPGDEDMVDDHLLYSPQPRYAMARAT
jgi:hypothetical protein